ncbi:hypothetical protein LWC34_30110 [Kibdelosporangium philippinense]|uniref:Secreted protein n=1 Tax=Kibdelosporangium philippinense TaxID=211113 RepID=A0ABS8ZKR7_9PSEU|nr:hypothetical protein [Kibdelosporangium philippinense]MCE7007053.1 hypothetical protein [Kibdelosporangium philippinense]
MGFKRIPRMTPVRLLILAACVAAVSTLTFVVGGWVGPGLAGGLIVFLGVTFAERWRRQDSDRQAG